MIEGSFDGTELWVRCWRCGDSDRNPNTAHCSINVYNSLYHCYKCSAGGRLGSYELGVLTRGLRFDRTRQLQTHEEDGFLEAIESKLKKGPGINRYSALDRQHIVTNTGLKLDVFRVTNAVNELCGYHIRPANDKKGSRTYGRRMLGLSSKLKADKTWRLVEGPYDCVDPHMDICVFGLPSDAQVRALYGKPLILCPDGDIWQDYRKLRLFMSPFLKNHNIIVESVERLPSNTDPDELMPHKRERLDFSEVRAMLTPKRTFFVERMLKEAIAETKEVTDEVFWASYT